MSLDTKEIQTGVFAGLTAAGSHLFNKIKGSVSNLLYPEAIKKSMSLEPVKQRDNYFYVDIVFDLKEAPMTLAFEFGSGLYATRGVAKKYEILPKDRRALAIPEAVWERFEFPLRRGAKMIGLVNYSFLLRWVDHPGIEARPFMRPTIRAEKQTMKRLIGDEFKVILHGNKFVETF